MPSMPGQAEPKATIVTPSVGSLLSALATTRSQGKGLVLNLRTGAIQQLPSKPKASNVEASPSDPRTAGTPAARRPAAESSRPSGEVVTVSSATRRAVPAVEATAASSSDSSQEASRCSPSSSSSSSEGAIASEASRSRDGSPKEEGSEFRPACRGQLVPSASPPAGKKPFNSLAPTPVASRERGGREESQTVDLLGARLTPRRKSTEAALQAATSASPPRWRPSGEDHEEEAPETLTPASDGDSSDSPARGNSVKPPTKTRAELVGRRDLKDRREAVPNEEPPLQRNRLSIKGDEMEKVKTKRKKHRKPDIGQALPAALESEDAVSASKKRPGEEKLETRVTKLKPGPPEALAENLRHSADPRLGKSPQMKPKGVPDSISKDVHAVLDSPAPTTVETNKKKKRKKEKKDKSSAAEQGTKLESGDEVPPLQTPTKPGQMAHPTASPAVSDSFSFWGTPTGSPVAAASAAPSAMSIASGAQVVSQQSPDAPRPHVASPFDMLSGTPQPAADRVRRKKRRKKDKEASGSSSSGDGSGDPSDRKRRRKRKHSRHRRKRHAKDTVRPPDAWTVWPPPSGSHYPPPWGWPGGPGYAHPPASQPGSAWAQLPPQPGAAWAQPPAAAAGTALTSAVPAVAAVGTGVVPQPASSPATADNSSQLLKVSERSPRSFASPASRSNMVGSPLVSSPLVDVLNFSEAMDEALTEVASADQKPTTSSLDLLAESKGEAESPHKKDGAAVVDESALGNNSPDGRLKAHDVSPAPKSRDIDTKPAAMDTLESSPVRSDCGTLEDAQTEMDPYMTDPYMAGLPEASDSSAGAGDDASEDEGQPEDGVMAEDSYGVAELEPLVDEVVTETKPLDPSLETWQGSSKTAWDFPLLLDLDQEFPRLAPPDDEEVVSVVGTTDRSNRALDASEAVEASARQRRAISAGHVGDAELIQMPLWGVVGEWGALLISLEIDDALRRDPAKIKSAERRQRHLLHTEQPIVTYDVDGDTEVVEPNPASPPLQTESMVAGVEDLDASAGPLTRGTLRTVSWQPPPQLQLPSELLRDPAKYIGTERSERANARAALALSVAPVLASAVPSAPAESPAMNTFVNMPVTTPIHGSPALATSDFLTSPIIFQPPINTLAAGSGTIIFQPPMNTLAAGSGMNSLLLKSPPPPPPSDLLASRLEGLGAATKSMPSAPQVLPPRPKPGRASACKSAPVRPKSAKAW